MKKKVNIKRKIITFLAITILISLLIITSLTLFSASASNSEPSTETILNKLGFTNLVLSNNETFSSGTYNVTLLAEFASYHSENELSYYEVETNNYQTIFSGAEGAKGTSGGYVIPPISKTFSVNTQFGLSMLAPQHRYFTEHRLNPDYPEKHAQVYTDLDRPNTLLICFENFFGGYDRDYNDMIISLKLIDPLIANVTRSPEIPNYDQSVSVTAQVFSDYYDIESVILSYQMNSASWINLTMNQQTSAYVAEIPPQPYNSKINYKVYAFNTIENFAVSTVSSYTVGDFISPIISNVIQVPRIPSPNMDVTISATVSEPPNASGVKNVTIWYTINGFWAFLEMSIIDDVWTSTIPRQNQNNIVKYFIESFDNAENNFKTSTFAYTIKIPNSPPVADFISSSNAYTNEIVDFNASGSYDPDGHITRYIWDFGDGNNGTESQTSHSYVDDGEYTIKLTVFDNKGTTDTKTTSINVRNRPPVADFTISTTSIEKRETVTFNAEPSYDSDGTIIDYFWDFGDGNIARGANINYSFADSGIFKITLTVTDDDGATDSKTTTKNVSNKLPVAIFTDTAKTVYVSDVITFNATESYDQDGSIVSYFWDFGDGNTATGKVVNHSYQDDGKYTVTLTVTDDDAATNSTTSTKNVLNRSPVASFTENATTVMVNEVIHFDGTASHDYDGSILSYEWDFDDGNTANGAVVNHKYEDDGTYIVTLTVKDDDDATDTTTTTINVINKAPIASFTESTKIVVPDESIHFDASESYDPDGTIVSYFWDFGDGNTATGITTDHLYIEEGTYTVTLMVKDNDGASASAFSEISVEITVTLGILSVIGLGITTLTATLLYGLFTRRKKKKQAEDI